jgi:hypothetical protein
MGNDQASLKAQAATTESGQAGGMPACDRRKHQRRRNQPWWRLAEDRRLCPGRRLLDWTTTDPRHRTAGAAP